MARYNHVAWTTPNDGEVLASLLGGVPPSIGGMAGGGGWGGRLGLGSLLSTTEMIC